MPLKFHRKLQPEGELGLWTIAEPEVFFLEQLLLSKREEEYIAEMKGHRRLEWLAGRWLLHKMSGRMERGACIKDEFGKPHLEGSLYEISISHSRELVAVMAAPRSVGVDIQKLVGKIERLAHKYMRPEELASLEEASRLEHLHVYWGAKECLYKAYGRRQLDFRAHIHIDPFAYDLQNGRCTGKVQKDAYECFFELYYEMIEDFMLVYALEDIGDVRLA